MHQTTVNFQNLEVSFSQEDIVNPDDCIYQGESNPHNVRGWLFHDHGFTICVAFADSLQDALDEAADSGKLGRFKIEECDYGDYGVDTDTPTCDWLGNLGMPYDIESLGYFEIPPPVKQIYGQTVEAMSSRVS